MICLLMHRVVLVIVLDKLRRGRFNRVLVVLMLMVASRFGNVRVI